MWEKFKKIVSTITMVIFFTVIMYASYIADEFNIKKRRIFDLAPICSNCGQKILK